MQTPSEQLQALADQWAAKLGGKIKVGLQVLVNSGPESLPPFYCADLGPTLKGWHCCTKDGIEQAMAEAERQWRLDGAPTDPKDAERCKLRARAAELGMRVVEDEPERDEPVIYHRGELPPADTRTEHDKSL